VFWHRDARAQVALGHSVRGRHHVGQRRSNPPEHAQRQKPGQQRQSQREAAAPGPRQDGRLGTAAEKPRQQARQRGHPADHQQGHQAKHEDEAQEERATARMAVSMPPPGRAPAPMVQGRAVLPVLPGRFLPHIASVNR
jgi:hypothetical protein